MTPEDVIAIARRALEITVLLSAPVLLTSLIVGVLISVFQAVTQIQEQTLSFVPKFLAVIIVFLFSLPWALDLMTRYTVELFLSFQRFAG
ncbi:MAG: flagellar biosynthesis protein FliQ [Deltaproteobacteria bacterium]|nr:flagellar biosynthesis protein FliQ [Deltaproteobacteria bacterium]